MKNLLCLLLRCTLSFAFPFALFAAEKTVTLSVPTVVCGMCVKTVSKAVKAVAGVSAVKVDLKAKTATVTYDDALAVPAQLETAIADAGYDANALKRNAAAFEKLHECCKAQPKP